MKSCWLASGARIEDEDEDENEDDCGCPPLKRDAAGMRGK